MAQRDDFRPRDRFGRPLPEGSRNELIGAVSPTEVVDSAAEAHLRALALFDDQRFFEAHEFFEFVWKSEEIDPRDRPFWKGLTQLAAGCCHVQRGNERGARTLLERATARLEPYGAHHHGVDLTRLIAAAGDLARQMDREGASEQLAFPRIRPV